MPTEITPSLNKLAEELVATCECYKLLSTEAVGAKDAEDNLYLIMKELVARDLLATASTARALRAGNFVLRNAITYEPILFGPSHSEIKFNKKAFALECMRAYEENEPSKTTHLFKVIE